LTSLRAVRHHNRTIKDYKAELEKADTEKIARLIKIVGILLQTKVYLFWAGPKARDKTVDSFKKVI
jgi:hypothetical protein